MQAGRHSINSRAMKMGCFGVLLLFEPTERNRGVDGTSFFGVGVMDN